MMAETEYTTIDTVSIIRCLRMRFGKQLQSVEASELARVGLRNAADVVRRGERHEQHVVGEIVDADVHVAARFDRYHVQHGRLDRKRSPILLQLESTHETQPRNSEFSAIINKLKRSQRLYLNTQHLRISRAQPILTRNKQHKS
jgi:hypothetical protein